GRDRVVDPLALPPGPLQLAEVLPDERLDALLLDVTDDDDGHQVRAVPVPIEAGHLIAGAVLDALRQADRLALQVAGDAEQHAVRVRPDPGPDAEPGAPLGEDDAALRLDLFGVERDALRPVVQDPEGGLERALGVRRNGEPVGGVAV